jgi:hypothetical protein
MTLALGFLSLAGLLLIVTPSQTQANLLPCYYSETDYYNDSDCTEYVGYALHDCWGQQSSGGSTGPYVRYVDDCCNEDNRGLCCDFYQSNCQPS